MSQRSKVAIPRVIPFHLGFSSVQGSGIFDVARGESPAARLAATVLRLPLEGRTAVRVQVVRPDDDLEVWRRWFGERLYTTEQRRVHLTRLERIGPFELCYQLRVTGSRVSYLHDFTSIRVGRLALRLPWWLGPRVTADAEAFDDDRFFVAVSLKLPVLGTVLRYEGYVEEEV